MDDPEDKRKTPQGKDFNAQLYRVMADAASDAIFVVDEQTDILFVNRAGVAMFGYSHGELVGQNVSLLMEPRDREPASQGLVRYLQAGGGQLERKGTECTAVHKSGRKMPVEFSLGQFHDENKPRFVGVVRDLSERKKAETEIRQVQEALRQSQKMEAIGQLSAGLAHDFNNLLGVIIGFSELLLEQLPQENSAFRHKAEEIKKAGNRAAALTRQLLAFGRKQVLEPKVIDLNGVVSDLCKMLDRLLGKEIDLVVKLEPALGQVLADTFQIEQVILNLIVNARDAMPLGGRLTIATVNEEVSEAQALQHYPMNPGSYVMVAVSDTGVGMDKGTQARIFEPFFTTKALGKGTGLGLATVYGAVKQSGGYIWVDSEPGRGTTFRIHFPRVQPLPAEAPLAADPAPKQRGSETILLVEDSEPLRNFLRDVLRSLNFTVLEAANPSEAIESAKHRRGPVHLLLTDVELPAMKGHDLAERIASLRPDIKVLYISGYTDAPIVQRTASGKGIAFLQKPFSSHTLSAKIRQLLDG